jgi:hypothetical protein
MVLVKCSIFCVFWPEFDDVNLDKIAILCCLNCIFEHVGLMVKNMCFLIRGHKFKSRGG